MTNSRADADEDSDEEGVIQPQEDHAQEGEAAQDAGLGDLSADKAAEGLRGEGGHVQHHVVDLLRNICLQDPSALPQQGVLTREHVDGKDQGQHHGDDDRHQPTGEGEDLWYGGREGGEEAVDELLQVLAELGEIQLFQVEPGHELIEPHLGLAEVAAEVGGKTAHAAGELGDDKGEDGGHHTDEEEVGEGHRQGKTEAGQRRFAQALVQGPPEKGAGPAEDKGDGQAGKEGCQLGEDQTHCPPQVVKTDHQKDQGHGEGDEQQQTAEELFVHESIPILVMW